MHNSIRQFKIASFSNVTKSLSRLSIDFKHKSVVAVELREKLNLSLSVKNCWKVFHTRKWKRKKQKELIKRNSGKNCWIFLSCLTSSLSFKVTNGENNKLLFSMMHKNRNSKHQVFSSLVLPLPSIVLTYQKLVKLSTIMMVAVSVTVAAAAAKDRKNMRM